MEAFSYLRRLVGVDSSDAGGTCAGITRPEGLINFRATAFGSHNRRIDNEVNEKLRSESLHELDIACKYVAGILVTGHGKVLGSDSDHEPPSGVALETGALEEHAGWERDVLASKAQ